MRILAVDTAIKSCSAAVADENALVAETTMLSNETHSKHLMEMIDQVLRLADVCLEDLDGFAVTGGPGSFTGLRIGISTVKGFASAARKPLVGVSTLQSLASQACSCSHLICPLIDARKNEVYFCRYRYDDGILKQETQSRVAPIEKVVEGIREPCVFSGDGALRYQREISESLGNMAALAPAYHHIIRASTVAYLSMDRFIRADTDDVENFVPYYIRKSDAELKLHERKRKPFFSR